MEQRFNATYPIILIEERRMIKFSKDLGMIKANWDNDRILFRKLSSMICEKVWFREKVISDIERLLSSNNIPNFAHAQSGTNDITVAFHIRRGDKVHGNNPESPIYSENLYVQKLYDVIPNHMSIGSVKHCFVATDEYNVTVGIKDELRATGFECQIHYLVRPNTDKNNPPSRNRIDENIQFMAELYSMIHASIFVGTFSSNVGALVAPLRGCLGAPRSGYQREDEESSNHYFESYAVDRDDWHII